MKKLLSLTAIATIMILFSFSCKEAHEEIEVEYRHRSPIVEDQGQKGSGGSKVIEDSSDTMASWDGKSDRSNAGWIIVNIP